MESLFAPKQWEFICNAKARWNIMHGSVRAGKTVGSLFAFMLAVEACPDNHIAMIGYTSETIYRNAIKLILEDPIFCIFAPFCLWSNRKLHYKDKTIHVFGASNEGAIGSIQGQTFSVVYCDEMTLYPDSIIDMVDTRLSKEHSIGFATCNPSHPNHKVKKWVDAAAMGDKNYYALSFLLGDNPFLPEDYKERIKSSSSGLFYKRNILGHWCLAEGAIFEDFDKNIHVISGPPRHRGAAEYYIAGIDFGMSNAFACVLIGVSTGKYTQAGKCMWVEKEYYWDPKSKGRQKTVSQYANDVREFIAPYGVRQIYMDPSAEVMEVELRQKGVHVVHGNNNVEYGIQVLTSEMALGNLFICDECDNLIREIEAYVWDPKATKKGLDMPLKQDDHAVDALRYAIATHKVPKYYNDNEDFGRTLGYRR